MNSLWQDISYGFRMMMKSPGFTLVAVVAMMLGIGANTTIFSVVNAILLRPLPVAEPERLVNLHSTSPDGSSFHSFSYPDYVDYRDQNAVFDGLTAYTINTYSLTTEGQSERIFGIVTSENFFTVMGVRPAQGRFYTAEENRTETGEPVAVLSHGYWQRRFASDPLMIGKTLTLNGHAYHVIGIAPPKFTGPRVAFAPDIYVPVWTQPLALPSLANWLDNRRAGSLEMVGRLKPNVTIEGAQANISAIAQRLGEQYPDSNRGKGVEVRPTNTGLGQMEGAAIGFMGVLMAIVGLVLLIACANVAALTLSRSVARRREIAIRLAMGASRGRIVRQLLTESVLLFIFGGCAGLLLAAWLTDLLLAFKPPVPFTIELDLGFDWRVFGFTLLVSLATGIIFGLAPALQASRADVLPALKDEAGVGSYSRSRLRSLFVIGQVAVSLVLLVSTGLFLRSLQHARGLDPGFNPENVLNVGFDLSIQGYDEARGQQFYRQVMERVRALPGVESATLARNVPLTGGNMELGINVEGYEPPTGDHSFDTDFNVVAPSYFSSLGIRILSGRDFDERDREGAPRAGIVNETMARRFWPGEDAVGKRFFLGPMSEGVPVEIVGVVKDGKYRTLGEDPRPYFYLSSTQEYQPQMTLHIRTAPGNSASVLAGLRQEVDSIDRTIPFLDVMPLTRAIGVSLIPIKVASTVAGLFGLVGLILAGVGIFGIVSYSVTQRTREIGIRTALGAQRADVLRLVISQGMRLAIIGVVVGLLLSVAVTRLLSSLLYGISATDAVTFTGVAVLLILIALLASYIPARRATRVDPMVALRYE
ncbi:MAG TPA: ABC transporter permease [Pyrinomonadaceae bacterium]|nr:ABC transporter permease [Pyrinomonadaceae bacterium]